MKFGVWRSTPSTTPQGTGVETSRAARRRSSRGWAGLRPESEPARAGSGEHRRGSASHREPRAPAGVHGHRRSLRRGPDGAPAGPRDEPTGRRPVVRSELPAAPAGRRRRLGAATVADALAGGIGRPVPTPPVGLSQGPGHAASQAGARPRLCLLRTITPHRQAQLVPLQQRSSR